MVSSPLTGLPAAKGAIKYGFLLAVTGVIAILASSIFTMFTSLPNQLSASATFPGENGKIAFVGPGRDNPEIYVMNADGSGRIQLTNIAGNNWLPDWSPDGTKIAFTTGRHGDPFAQNEEIYVMNADGSEQIRLTDNPSYDREPCWSPDGTKIAFNSKRDGNEEIYVMNADGSEQTRITDTLNAADRRPEWSPDGTKIAFVSTREGPELIYVMNADGSEQRRISDGSGSDFSFDWSPDG